MKVYISMKFQDKDRYVHVKNKLEENGYTVVSRWDKHVACKPFSKHHDICKEQSDEDLLDIESCDIFLMEYLGVKGSGMFFELGYAVAKREAMKIKEVVAIGPNIGDTSMFIHLDDIKTYECLDDFLNERKYNAC